MQNPGVMDQTLSIIAGLAMAVVSNLSLNKTRLTCSQRNRHALYPRVTRIVLPNVRFQRTASLSAQERAASSTNDEAFVRFSEYIRIGVRRGRCSGRVQLHVVAVSNGA